MSRLVLIAILVAAGVLPAAAQQAAAAPPVEFLPRALFHLGAQKLADADIRFRWDGNFGGELDLVDYRAGRLTFFTNYEVVMGEEFRVFDPNQGNYILEGSASARLPAAEVAFVFYHQSRHLSDRPKEFAIDWNMAGVRGRRAFLAGAVHVDARADVRWVVQRSYVDYDWEIDGRLRGDYVVRPGVGLLVSGVFRHLGTDDTRGRTGVTGFRGEAGIRFDGGAGAMEFYVAAERRIDPYPLEFGTEAWVSAGFRLLSR